MSFILKKFDKLAEIEDEELMGLYYKLYGPTLQWTLMFPSWKRSNIPLTFGTIIFYTVTMILHYAILTVSVINLRDDFESASMAFHYWLIFTFAIITVFLLNKDRQKFAATHRVLATELGHYKPGKIYDEDKPQEYEKNKKTLQIITQGFIIPGYSITRIINQKELIIFLFLPGLVLLIASIVLTVPYIQKFNNPAKYNSRGVNMNLPLATYYPFPSDSGLVHGLVVMGQLSAALSLASLIIIMEILLFRVSQSIIFEYRILQYAISTLFKRSKRLYFHTYPERASTKVQTRSPEFQECIKSCISDCVKHHHTIQKLLEAFEMTLKWPAAMGYTFGTGAIGLGLVNLLLAKNKEDYESMVLFTLINIVEVLNMYIISAFGEAITTESEILRRELYYIDWYKLNVQNRKTMLNFQIGIMKPVVVKAGGLVALSMDTFSSIMNTSYSFFNLANANFEEGS